MENNKSKQNIIITLLIINLIAIIIFAGRKMDDLEESVYQINNNVNNLSSQINNLEYGVKNQIDEIKEAELNYVTDFDYEYSNLNTENKTMFTKFTIELRESKVNSQIYLVAKTEDGRVERELLELEKGLVYAGGLSLKLASNYSFNLEEDVNGNLKQLNYEPYNIWLKDEFYNNRVNSIYTTAGADDKSSYINYRFDLNTMGVEDFEIAKIRLEVLQADEVIYSEDTGEGLFKLDDLSEEDLLKVTARELIIDRPKSFGSSSTREESATEEVITDAEAHEIQSDTSMTTGYVYQKVIVYEDLANYAGEGIQERLVITFKDGSEFQIR